MIWTPDADTARIIRRSMLDAAKQHRADYRRERMGFHRRMFGNALQAALTFRRIEHNTERFV